MAKRRRRTSNKAKRRLILIAPLATIIIIWFLITSTNYVLNIITLNNEQKNLQRELIALKENEEKLKNEIEKLKDPDYIARFARENYLYSKNGEYIIQINEPEVKLKDNTKIDSIYLKYVIDGSIVFAVLILFFIVRKK